MNQNSRRICATIRISDLLAVYRNQQKTGRARRFICTTLTGMLVNQLKHHPQFAQFKENVARSCNDHLEIPQEMYNFIFQYMNLPDFEQCIYPKLNKWCMGTFQQEFHGHHDLDRIAVQRQMTFFEVRERILQHAIRNNPDEVFELDFS